MPPVGDTKTLSIEDFRTMRDFIHDKAGMYFADNKLYLLQSRLAKRMSELGVATFRDYFYRVKYDASHREFNELMNLVTTNETYYFRNEPQLDSFAKAALPEILEMKRKSAGQKTLRIWSAGCSTGEEPYTLAMLILDALKGESGWRVEIIANDISEQALQKARSGVYAGPTLRYVKPEALRRFFDKDGDSYKVKREVKALVKFVQLNLNDTNKLALYKNLDIIFCRNVMIYFSEDVKRKIVRAFYQALTTGGHMFIGHSETLHGISKAFKLKYYNGALVYVKDESEKVRGADMVLPSSQASSQAKNQKRAARPTSAVSAKKSGATKALGLLAQIKAKQAAQKNLATK